MRRTKGANNDERHITQTLRSLDVDILQPQSEHELEFAEALYAFSSFVLIDEVANCRSVIERYMASNDGKRGGVGVLQGGDEHDIYRLQIRDDNEDDDEEENSGGYNQNPGTAAATEMLQAFHASPHGSRYRKKLTVARLKKYLLNMCERWKQNRPPGSPESYRRYMNLGNLMWILSFGPVPGQYRHIDNIDPNNQICCYISDQCPSTVVYHLDGPDIVCGEDLLQYWDEVLDDAVPNLIKEMLTSKCDERLDDPSRRAYIPPRLAAWGTVNETLLRFGKLYRPVRKCLSLPTDPGATLVAGGNEVHAGPPTSGPRMFAFAVGIPDADDKGENGFGSHFDGGGGSDDGERSHQEDASANKSGDGEVQYCPALLHLDLCSILFGVMKNEYLNPDAASEHRDCKLFLIKILVDYIAENPNETYAQNLADEKRKAVREWIEKLCDRIQINSGYDDLIEEAATCNGIICGEIQEEDAPGAAKKKKKKAKGRSGKKGVNK